MQMAALDPFRDDHRFESVRQTGTVTALDLKVTDPGYLTGIGPGLNAFFASRNLLMRPLGNTI